MAQYQVDGWNNFCRVFELPTHYPEGFCFGGGKQVVFQMVDWFNPVPGMSQIAVSKKIWIEKVGPIESISIDPDDLQDKLTEFLRLKQYVMVDRTYLVVCDFGFSFTFTKI